MRQTSMANCEHSGFHSGVGILARDVGAIRFVLVCDVCGEEVREVSVEDYALGRDPSGDHPARRRAA